MVVGQGDQGHDPHAGDHTVDHVQDLIRGVNPQSDLVAGINILFVQLHYEDTLHFIFF